MFDLQSLLNIHPYSLSKSEKEDIFNKYAIELTKHHIQSCNEYKNILNALDISFDSYRNLPFLPVSLFKELNLKSIDDTEIFKVMTSSGTTGQSVSKIYLDKETASLQQKVLVKIVTSFLQSQRVPMLIIDSESVLKNRNMFSARGAGILGFSIFASDKAYALNDNMELDIEKISKFLQKHEGKNIMLFGFTFMIWQHFYKELLKSNISLDLSNAVLIHGGGWKKLISESVSSDMYKKCLFDVCKISKVHDYYGMVEQTGCIYMECEHGHLHASIFSDVITRRSHDFSICNYGEKGIIQAVSLLPKSYPGHSLLTEDEGIILGEDDCKCGRKGKYFKILGRLKNAEIRGCSDTYAVKYS